MLWVAALLSLIIWVIGWQSGFLGWLIHLFLLAALFAALAALLPRRASERADPDPETLDSGQ
jgi:membrane protein implicated in regulation of membrane protease activity